MSDFFKDPNAMNFGELFREMGVGLIAVGVDRALKEAGKKNGLLYGPGGTLLATMILNREASYAGVNLTQAEGAIGNLISNMSDEDPEALANALFELYQFQNGTQLSDATKGQFTAQFDAVSDAVIQERNDALLSLKERMGPHAMRTVPGSAPPVTFKECLGEFYDATTPASRKDEVRAILSAGLAEAKLSGDVPESTTLPEYIREAQKEHLSMKYIDKLESLYADPPSRSRTQQIKSCSSRIRSAIDWGDDEVKTLCGRCTSEIHLPTLERVMKQGGQKKDEKLQSMIKSLKRARESGGGIAVSMGYNGDTGHVNYVQEWGTPSIAGVAVSSKDVSRCIMNLAEDGGMSSAWMADRNIDTSIDVERLKVGLEGMRDTLTGKSGTVDVLVDINALIAETTQAVTKLESLATAKGYSSYAKMMADADLVERLVKSPQYQDSVRGLEAKGFDFLQKHLAIKHEAADLVEDNIVIMASNTERDNRVTDDAKDRFRVGRGNIGSQKTGTANALDGSYFVPLDIMASGWDSMVPLYTDRYQGAESRDHYALLTSLTVVC